MRVSFVHETILRLEPGADTRAPGAAVTVELCGHWEHDGACRWPHLSTVSGGEGNALTLRVIFAAEPHDEAQVRERIVRALKVGRLEGAPAASRWTVESERVAELREEERSTADDLVTRATDPR